MRLPLLVKPAPFTVAATVHGLPMAFPAENAYVAAEITQDLSFRDAETEPCWGPSTTQDGQPWPVAILAKDAGAVHFLLIPAGYAIPVRIPAACGQVMPLGTADFTGRGRPCSECLSYWQVAHAQVEPSRGSR